LSQKRAEIFGKNILKIITSVPGVDVMNTNFVDFRRFSAKNIGVLLDTQWSLLGAVDNASTL
jgi:hypothetical protein